MKLRRRAVLKWTGAGLCALIFAVWGVSGWAVMMWVLNGSNRAAVVYTSSGTLGVHLFGHALPPHAHSDIYRLDQYHTSPQWTWWDFGVRADPSMPGTHIYVPLWFLFLLIGGPSANLWRLDRPRPSGACDACGYDLSGLPPGAACPECGGGKAAHPAQQQSSK